MMDFETAYRDSQQRVFNLERRYEQALPQLGVKEAVMTDRTPKVGQTVVWHNAVGLAHQALVTAVWSPTCINLVVVSSDEKKQADCGRQIERYTSSLHGKTMNVHGFYWRFEDEEPNAYIPPVER
jgi:hypothetical protein